MDSLHEINTYREVYNSVYDKIYWDVKLPMHRIYQAATRRGLETDIFSTTDSVMKRVQYTITDEAVRELRKLYL